MSTNMMNELWTTFADLVLPDDAPQIQRQEMRRAFYAGAWGMFNFLMGLEGLSEREREMIAQRVRGECQDFMTWIDNGEA